jgi:hypothetical protein
MLHSFNVVLYFEHIKEHNMKNTKRQIAEEISRRVAAFWLTSCQSILRRGESPAPLSQLALRYVREEIAECEACGRFKNWDTDMIARMAVDRARHQLYMQPELGAVRNHFGMRSAHQA